MAASRQLSRRLLPGALVVAAWGCEMDDHRTLHPAEPGGEAGAEADTLTSSGSGGTTAATSQTATSSASTAASSTTGNLVENRCPDLNENEVPDCDETLAGNASFDGDTENWEAEAPAEIHWEEVAPDATSGVLVVTHAGTDAGAQPTMAGSFQCITVHAQSRYRFLAESFIPEGQAGALSGISALFYASSDCSGRHLGAVNSPLQSAEGSWRVVHGSGLAPAHSRSLKLRLVVVKDEQAAAVGVRFDNVLMIRE